MYSMDISMHTYIHVQYGYRHAYMYSIDISMHTYMYSMDISIDKYIYISTGHTNTDNITYH